MDCSRAAKMLCQLIVAVSMVVGGIVSATGRDDAARIGEIAVVDLPSEARTTVALIKKGGPFPYERDGIGFGNFERLLPIKPKGYYHEYTVSTPGTKHRGARRIVAGKDGELFYTDDHYKSFKRIRE